MENALGLNKYFKRWICMIWMTEKAKTAIILPFTKKEIKWKGQARKEKKKKKKEENLYTDIKSPSSFYFLFVLFFMIFSFPDSHSNTTPTNTRYFPFGSACGNDRGAFGTPHSSRKRPVYYVPGSAPPSAGTGPRSLVPRHGEHWLRLPERRRLHSGGFMRRCWWILGFRGRFLLLGGILKAFLVKDFSVLKRYGGGFRSGFLTFREVQCVCLSCVLLLCSRPTFLGSTAMRDGISVQVSLWGAVDGFWDLVFFFSRRNFRF